MKRKYFFLLVCLALIACSKDDSEAPDLGITAISPNTGSVNTIVTFTGTAFSPNKTENEVTLNNIPCEVVEATDKELKVKVPEDAGSGNFVITVNGKTVASTFFTYTIEELSVTSIAPEEGPKNTIVTITGKGFKSRPEENIVTLNDIPCLVAHATPTELKVVIPVKAGSGPLKVEVKDQRAESKAFTYIFTKTTITTIAGSTKGDDDKFDSPSALTVDKEGNLYVADYFIHKIKKVTSSGVISTLPRSNPGEVERFWNPNGLVLDEQENIYVADVSNHKIKKILPTGYIATLAGSTQGDGEKFYYPSDVALDEEGNVYVADASNHKIKKVTSSGVVTTLAGSNQGDGTNFNAPLGLVIDKGGNIYVSDYSNHKIKKVTPSGEVSTLAGSTQGDGERFNHPRGLALDKDGNILVADSNNHKIKKVSPTGVVSTLAGTTRGDGDNFNFPTDVAVDKDGVIYVADRENYKIKKIEQE